MQLSVFSFMWKGCLEITTVSVWREQEQLLGRPALSASSALAVSLQRKKNSFGFMDSMQKRVCVFNIFSAEIENKKQNIAIKD